MIQLRKIAISPLLFFAMLLSQQAALADVGVAIGINFTYHGNVGITLKALSSDKHDQRVFAVGSTYYPLAEKKIGFDLGYGAAGFNVVGLIGIDILQEAAYLSVGYENMSKQ